MWVVGEVTGLKDDNALLSNLEIRLSLKGPNFPFLLLLFHLQSKNIFLAI